MSKGLRDQILLLLEEHARTGSPYFKEDKEIAEQLGRSVDEIQRQLDILESRGLITAANSYEGNSARISPQGSLEAEQLEESVGVRHQTLPVGQSDPRRVFVVHGRNQAARSAVSAFLRSIDLQPIEWSEAVSLTGEAAPFVGQVVEVGFSAAQAVVVILTGDDLAQLRPELLQHGDPTHEREPTPQARPNVLFEAGYAFAKHPSRTIILEFGLLRPFSDVQGRHVIRMNDTGEKRQELANRLAAAGCSVSLRGTDWHSAGDFSGLM